MRLRWNASWKPGKIELLLQPGDEIEVPDELGETLARAYERLEVVTSSSKKAGKSALARAQEEGQAEAQETEKAQEAADAAATAEPAPRPRRKSTARKSTAKRSTAKKSAAKSSATATAE